MKFKVSKKLIVSSLASVMAVSLVGAVTGTVAWYQYNTRVTTSLIGMNAAETGILEISTTSASAGFKRDITSADILTASGRDDFDLTPMTFAGGNMTADGALPLVASSLAGYKNPDKSSKEVVENGSNYSTMGSYATNWDESDDYIQFDMWIRARDVDNVSGGFKQTAEEVYLTDYVLESIGGADITNAMRIHFAIDADGDDTVDSNALVSKDEVADLPLHGMLDQDNDGIADRIGGYEWATHRSDVIDYGKGNDYTQTTAELDSKLATRAADGTIETGTPLFTTPISGATKITVTIWVEGWHKEAGFQKSGVVTYAYTDGATINPGESSSGKYCLYDINGEEVENNYVAAGATATAKRVKPENGTNVADGTYFADKNCTEAATGTADGSTYYYQKKTYYTQTPTNNIVADWSGEDTANSMFKFGLTFDVGRDAFVD